jgi:signal transduction histidine kinase
VFERRSKSHRQFASVTLPIGLGVTAGGLTIALLVGWTLILARNEPLQSTSLLVLGIVSYVVVIGALAALSWLVVRQMREVSRQDSFIDSVTHELKSPLASIRLALETLERPQLKPEQREQLRVMMLGDVDRLSSFIDDVLEASRILHGRKSHLIQDVPIAVVAHECLAAVGKRRTIPEGSVVITVPDSLQAHTDPTALSTMLRNLIDNAVKYSKPDGVQVAVNAEAYGAQVAITVRDRGIGIPKSQLGRVSERFFRVPSEAVRSRPGTGIGLFVVKALAQSLGGRLVVDSEGEGHGTTVRVWLPRGDDERR